MDRYSFLVAIIRCLKGFATSAEVLKEYRYLLEVNEGCEEDAQQALLDNIEAWLRWDITDSDPAVVVWDRLAKEGF